MKLNMKALVLSMGMVSVLGLTACQSTMHADSKPTTEQPGQDAHNGKGPPPPPKETRQDHEALDKACADHVGQTVSIKLGDRTLDGTCQLEFRPEPPKDGKQPPAPKDGQLPPPPKDGQLPPPPKDGQLPPPPKDGQLPPPPKDGQLPPPKDDQHKADHDALNKACEGKAGQKIEAQLNGKTIKGECRIQFRPNPPKDGQQPPQGQPGDMPPPAPASSAVATN